MKRFLSILFTALICLSIFATFVYAADAADYTEVILTGNNDGRSGLLATSARDYYVMAKVKFTVKPNTPAYSIDTKTILQKKTLLFFYSDVKSFVITDGVTVQNALDTTQSIEYRKSGYTGTLDDGDYYFYHNVDGSCNAITQTFTTTYA